MPYTSVTNIFSPNQSTFFFMKKMPSNNFNFHSDYSNVLTIQIDICFPNLYFSSIIRAQIDHINKQILIDIVSRFESQH